ncbi:MAG: hypothetical protein WKF37_19685 [Bryobacteraceae bacterium]
MHRLYFMNSKFVAQQTAKVAAQLEKYPEPERLTQAYRMLFARNPIATEMERGRAFLQHPGNSWPLYIQVLLSSAEFSSIP